MGISSDHGQTEYNPIQSSCGSVERLFAREYRNEEDPYLESREKEDAFLERVETAIREWSERVCSDGYGEESI